jgi:hypothetical protein
MSQDTFAASLLRDIQEKLFEVLHASKTQREAIDWAKNAGHTPLQSRPLSDLPPLNHAG